MIKLLLLLASLGATGTCLAQSQNYRAFKVDITSGYSNPSAGGSGLNLSIEPKYNITDNIAVGFKYEGAVLGGVSFSNGSILGGVRATLLTGEYAVGDGMIRPYVGAGLGFYKSYLLAITEDESELVAIGDNQFGFAPRAGLQIGHFRLGIEYNLVSNGNYFSVKTGFTIGGGRK